MFALAKFAVALVSAPGSASSAVAAPVGAPGFSDQIVWGPYNPHNGWTTWYNPSAGFGACGWFNGDYEWVAAIGNSLFQEMMIDGNPNHCQACGKTATVTYGDKSITVMIVDRCYACGYDDIDLSPSAFQQFADLGVGKLFGVSWVFN
ncbi:hypothetical protein OPQ81_011364 [Rhizoctonia solani]|nr:hypothetical protein OPQ81_011364 [Rhizoctonia solani]